MNRDEAIGRLGENDGWDLAIVGGGATGLSCALDAAARGLRTLLLERDDFAQGTSSRSTKLIHGGVRYLRQGHLGLVRSALHERTFLLRNAPHCVHPLDIVLPAYSYWEKFFYGTGLKIYDALAAGHQPRASRLLSRDETLESVPTARADGLRGGVRYTDGQFDDTALALTFAGAAWRHGATLLNHAPVVSLLRSGGRISGVAVRDEETGRTFEVAARVVINATGPFTDEICRLDGESEPLLGPSQGAHLVLPREFLPADAGLLIPKTSDGRLLFALPWHGRTLLGTTDTPVNGIAREPLPLAEEIEFLLEHAALYLSRKPSRTDVLSMFAGLRPLVRSKGATSAASRDHLIHVSESGLVTVTGGKWTTARKMAEDTVDRAVQLARLDASPCSTHTLRLPDPLPGVQDGLPDDQFVAAACRNTMARTVEDVLSRRVRLLYLDARAAADVAPAVASSLSRALGRDSAWEERQVGEFRALAAKHLP